MVDLKNRISVWGLGYIGLPFAAALAHVGYKIIGVDIDKNRIEMLKQGKIPFYEPGLRESLENNKSRLEYTHDTEYAMKNSDTIFVTIGTPIDEKNNPIYSQLDSCVDSIGKHLKKEQLVILKPTVTIGATEERVAPRLESLSGLKAGKDFYLAFCPERTVEGEVLREIFSLPKIIGGINKESAHRAEKIIKRLGGKVMIVSSPRVAEMCKLVDNMHRSHNIAFANEVGLVCESSNINALEVISAVNSGYVRNKIFRPGLGADGPCLSKDSYIFRFSALEHGTETPVTDGCISQNKLSTFRVVNLVKDFAKQHNLSSINLALVGLAFKGFPETDDPRDSAAMKILKALKEEKDISLSSVGLYDPLVKQFMNHQLSPTITDAVTNANVVMFLTDHPRVMNLELEHIFEKLQKPAFIFDAWGNLKFETLPKEINYKRIGVLSEPVDSTKLELYRDE